MKTSADFLFTLSEKEDWQNGRSGTEHGHTPPGRVPGFFPCLREWSKQYGKVFGIYFMRRPVLMTTDVDILKEVFIKDFANFPDRMCAAA
nr:hypothetical protein BaRGS_021108 [Batillaria attramentaria]